MRNKNFFLFRENKKIGDIALIENENGTVDVHKIEVAKDSVYTLKSPWWDLDGITKEVKKNQKKISEAVNHFIIKGCAGKIEEIKEYYSNMCDKDKEDVIKMIKETFNI